MAEADRKRDAIEWRRAAGELVLIIAGVLVALAVNTWWQGRQDRSREQAYLAQLLEDTRENERRLGAALAEETRTLAAEKSLLYALRSPAPIPSDSTAAWGRAGPLNYSDPRLLLGTVTALQQSGDLRLIGDDRLRVAIIGYAGGVDKDWEEFSRWVGIGMNAWLDIVRAVASRGEPYPEDDVALLQATVRTLRHDARLPVALQAMWVAGLNRVFYLTRMRDDTARLRRLLEAPGAGAARRAPVAGRP